MYRFILVIFLALSLQSANASTLSNSDVFEITFQFKMKIVKSGEYNFDGGDLVRQDGDVGKSYFRELSFSSDLDKEYTDYYFFRFDNDRFGLHTRYDSIWYDFKRNTGGIIFDVAEQVDVADWYDFDSDGTGRYLFSYDLHRTFYLRQAELSRISVRVTNTSTGEIVRAVDLSQVPLPASLPLLVFSFALALLRYGRQTNRGH